MSDSKVVSTDLRDKREKVIACCQECLRRWADPRNKEICDEQLHTPDFYDDVLVLLAAQPSEPPCKHCGQPKGHLYHKQHCSSVMHEFEPSEPADNEAPAKQLKCICDVQHVHAPHCPCYQPAATLAFDAFAPFWKWYCDGETLDTDAKDAAQEAWKARGAASAPATPAFDARRYAHKAIDHVLEMRKLDLERANDPKLSNEREYYLGRAHRCDDILFWLGHIEAQIPAGAASASSEHKAMRALESLTVGGSEFVGDIDACLAYVHKKISTLQDIAKRATVRANAFPSREEQPKESVSDNWCSPDVRKLAREIVADYDMHCEAIDDPDPEWLQREIEERVTALLSRGTPASPSSEEVIEAGNKMRSVWGKKTKNPWCREWDALLYRGTPEGKK